MNNPDILKIIESYLTLCIDCNRYFTGKRTYRILCHYCFNDIDQSRICDRCLEERVDIHGPCLYHLYFWMTLSD